MSRSHTSPLSEKKTNVGQTKTDEKFNSYGVQGVYASATENDFSFNQLKSPVHGSHDHKTLIQITEFNDFMFYFC